MYCPKCGCNNDDSSLYCITCGEALPRNAPGLKPPPPGDDGTLGGLIPYRNTPALVGYYLAVFSIIPCFFFLGIAAFILGIKGLQVFKQNPQRRGLAHSWVAIILGGLCGFGYTLFLVVPVIVSTLTFPAFPK